MGLISDKIRVGVLRGGPGPEYQVSINTGASVLENLPRDIYEPVDVFISKQGIWHENGFEKLPEKIVRKADVIFNALHGEYGEDGTVQKILDMFGVPYTGSGAMASALGMNKVAAKEVYKKNGLKVPFSVSISLNNLSREAIRSAYKSLPAPFVVKPASAGSSVGVRIAYSLPELEEMAIAAFEYSPTVMIEEFISGKEATCGVVDGWRGEKVHALMPIEIRMKSHHDFFNYDSKYSDPSSGEGAEEICPGNFSKEEKDAIEGMAIMAHSMLGLRHYSRSDFRVHPKRGVYILETNTLPGLTSHSLLPKSLHAAGAKLAEFLHHVINLALQRK
jgi:D-alanine-D-alanine ligase